MVDNGGDCSNEVVVTGAQTVSSWSNLLDYVWGDSNGGSGFGGAGISTGSLGYELIGGLWARVGETKEDGVGTEEDAGV